MGLELIEYLDLSQKRREGMDSDEIERCRFCGGTVTDAKVPKSRVYFVSFGSPVIKRCNRCQRTLTEEDIVRSRPSQMLGWVSIQN